MQQHCLAAAWARWIRSDEHSLSTAPLAEMKAQIDAVATFAKAYGRYKEKVQEATHLGEVHSLMTTVTSI